MLIAVLTVIVAMSSAWVYLDASKNKIGKIPTEKGMFNLSAGAWAISTLLLWIVALPAYLVKRGANIAKARDNPVEVRNRGLKTGALAALGGMWAIATISGVALSSLPECDSANTRSLIGQIVNDMPLMKSFGARFVAIKDIAEQGYNDEAGIRACAATLVTSAGENGLQYSIKWNDKSKSQYYVEARVQ